MSAVPTCGLGGPTFTAELVAGVEGGIAPEEYLQARALGLAHDDLVGAQAKHYPLVEYAQARALGTSPAQYARLWRQLSEGERGSDRETQVWGAWRYVEALRAGIYHHEYFAGLSAGWDMMSYISARRGGATAAEVAEIAHAERGVLISYATAREGGVSHAEYHEVSARVVSLYAYLVLRRRGYHHTEALDGVGGGGLVIALDGDAGTITA